MQRFIISSLSALVVITGFSFPAVAKEGKVQLVNDHYACSYRYRKSDGNWEYGNAGGATRFLAKDMAKNILAAKETQANNSGQSFESDHLFCQNVLGN